MSRTVRSKIHPSNQAIPCLFYLISERNARDRSSSHDTLICLTGAILFQPTHSARCESRVLVSSELSPSSVRSKLSAAGPELENFQFQLMTFGWTKSGIRRVTTKKYPVRAAEYEPKASAWYISHLTDSIIFSNEWGFVNLSNPCSELVTKAWVCIPSDKCPRGISPRELTGHHGREHSVDSVQFFSMGFLSSWNLSIW